MPLASSFSTSSHVVVSHSEAYKSQLTGLHGKHLDMLRKEKNSLEAGAPGGEGRFAVVDLSGSQYKVGVGDVLITDKLKPEGKWKVGEVVVLEEERVLLVGSKDSTFVGLPHVKNARVVLRVEENTRDAKVVVFKKRRRKASRRKRGYRAEKTVCRVLEVEILEE